jgi:Calcineurin-like phosphoesterase.
MILAVFGDVHGALDAMYWCVRRFEEKHRVRVVGVLQVGDMGVFPDLARLDQATWKRAKEDPTELGAADYVSGKKRATHPTWFVRGNHEDFDFLMRRRNRCIDPYGMIHHVYVGPVTVSSGGERCVVAGLGGVEDEDRFKLSAESRRVNRGGMEGWGRRIGELHRYSAYRWKYITHRELDDLSKLVEGEVDVLLTHEGPAGYFQDADSRGSLIVRRVVERLQPRYHFFGHHGGRFGADYEFWVGRTRSILLNERGVHHLPRRDGGMGILDTANWSFRFVLPGELD